MKPNRTKPVSTEATKSAATDRPPNRNGPAATPPDETPPAAPDSAQLQDTIRRLRSQVAAHPFARELKRDYIDVLADCAMETQFAPGEVIFQEGDFANRFYFLLTGEVALESRVPQGKIPVEMIGAGDVLGWSWLFPPYYWHFTARAVQPTRAIFFYGTWLREYCEEDRDFGFELFKRMAQVVIGRLQSTRLQLGAAMAIKSQAEATRGAAGNPPAAPKK